MSEKKDKLINFKVNETEHRWLMDLMKKQGVTMSEFVRERIFGKEKKTTISVKKIAVQFGVFFAIFVLLVFIFGVYVKLDLLAQLIGELSKKM